MHGKVEMAVASLIGGVLTASVTLDDGAVWHFKGGMVGPGIAAGGGSDKWAIDGEFGGTDHMDGWCQFNVTTGGVVANGVAVVWWDRHGQIGHAAGAIEGVGASADWGMGEWWQD